MHTLEFVTAVPVIVVATQYLKSLVPDRHRAVVPIVVGIAVSALAHYAGGAPVTEAIIEGTGLGALASSVRDYGVDNKDAIDVVKSTLKGE